MNNNKLLNLAIFVELIILFVFPDRTNQILNGIPLTNTFEYLFLLIVILNFSLYLINYFAKEGVTNSFLTKLKNLRIKSLTNSFNFFLKHHLKIFIFALFLKTLLFTSNWIFPPNVFNYCYRLGPNFSNSKCLYNLDNLFRINKTTYMQDKLYWNSKGSYEHWYKNDHILRHETEIKVTVSGVFERPIENNIYIEYRGKITGTIGNSPIALDSSTKKTILIPLEKGPNIIPINLVLMKDSFINTNIKPGYPSEIKMAPILKYSIYLLTIVKIFLLSFFAILFLAQILSQIRLSIYFLLIPIVGYITDYYHMKIALPLAIILFFTCTILEKITKKQVFYFTWIVIILSSLMGPRIINTNFDEIYHLNPGDDMITYQGMARSMIKRKSLLGSSPSCFYYQPGFRYFMIVFLSFFGEKNIFFKYLRLSFLLLFIWTLFIFIDSKINTSLISRLCSLIAMTTIVKASMYVVGMNLSEWLTWFFFIFAIIILFSPFKIDKSNSLGYTSTELSPYLIYMATSCLASCIIIRSNQLIGITLVFFLWNYLYLKKHSYNQSILKVLGVNTFIFFLITSLPAMYNTFYGGEFYPFIKSSSQAIPLIIYPNELLDFFSSENVRDKVFSQLTYLFVLLKSMHILTRLLFHLVLISFTSSLIYFYFVTKKVKPIIIALSIVTGFFGVHFFAIVYGYYPRHIIISYLLMGIISVLFWGVTRKKQDSFVI